MNWTEWKDRVRMSTRIFGIVLLAGVLLAACGDDDDDVDSGDDLDTTPTIEMTSPAGDEGDETMTEDSTATMADDMTATEDDASMTEEEDGSATADDIEGTATEDMTDGTATESDDDGTATEDMTDGTATEDDDMTATEDEDMTATEEDDGTATADDSDETATESDGTATESDDETATADDSDSAGDTGQIGDTIELDGFSITIDSVETFVGLPGVFEADQGNQLIAVNLTIENTGTADDLSVLRAMSSMHIEDGDGERHDVDLVATAILLFNQQGITDTQIEAGGEVSGAVGFQVPEDADELMLMIENDTGETTEIDLSDEF